MFHLLTFTLQKWSNELQTIVNNIVGMCTLASIDPSTTATISGRPFRNLGEISVNLELRGTLGVNNYLDQINSWGAQGNTYTYPDTTAAPGYRQVSVCFLCMYVCMSWRINTF